MRPDWRKTLGMTGKEREDNPKRRRLLRLVGTIARWACRVIFVLIAGSVLVLLALPSITDTSLVKGIAADVISDKLNGAAVKIETLRLDPLRGGLAEVAGLSVAPADDPDHPVLSMAKLSCRWSPFALLDGEVCITGVDVEGVSVRLSERGGQWNLLALLPPAPEVPEPPAPLDLVSLGIPMSVQLAGVTARDVTVELVRDSGEQAEVGPLWVACEGSFSEALRGQTRVWCGMQRVGARVREPVDVGFKAAITSRASVTRMADEEAVVKAAWSVREGRIDVPGANVALPATSNGEFEASLNLKRLGDVTGSLEVEVPDMVTKRVTFSVEKADKWLVNLQSEAEVEMAALGEFLAQTAESMGRARPLADLGELRRLSMAGNAKVKTTIKAEVDPGGETLLALELTNDTVTQRLGLEAAADVAVAGEERMGVALLVRDLDLRHHYEGSVALGKTLTVRTRETGTAALGELKADLGEMGALTCRTVGVSWEGSDQLPHPLSAAFTATVKAGAMVVERPGIGRFEVPLEVAAKVRAENLDEPSRSLIVVEDASGSMGSMIPSFQLQAKASAFGFGGLDVSGKGTVAVHELLALAEGVSEKLVLTGPDGEEMTAGELLQSLDVQGTVEGGVQVSGRLPREGKGGLKVALRGSADLAPIEFAWEDLEAAVGEAAADVECTAQLGSDYLPSSVKAHLTAQVSDALALAFGYEGALDEGEIELDGEASGAGLGEVNCTVKGIGSGIAAALPPSEEDGEFLVWEGIDVEGGCGVRLNVPRGDLLIHDAGVALPGIVEVTGARLEAKSYGGELFAAGGTVNLPDLGRLDALVPQGLALPMPLPELSGRVMLEGTARGQVPLAERFALAIRGKAPYPELELFPLRTFYEKNVPLSATGIVKLKDIAVSQRLGSDLSVSVSGVSGRCGLGIEKGNAAGSVVLSVSEVGLSLLPSPLKGFRAETQFSVDDFDRVALTDANLSLLEGVFTSKANVEVSGLSHLRGVPSPATALRLLSASVSGGCRIAPEAISVLDGWKGSGGAGADLSVELRGGESLKVESAGWLEDLSVECADLFAVEGLTARVPFGKQWRIVTAGEVLRETPLLSETVLRGPVGALGTSPVTEQGRTLAEWTARGLEPAVDRLTKPDQTVSVRAVSLLGRKVIDRAAVDVQTGVDSLRVPRASVGVLGGRLLARMASWREAGTYNLYVESGFDELDVRQILPPELRDFRGDASLTGNVRARAEIREGNGGAAGGNPVKDVSAMLDVTHIGPEALDRALLFLDPKAANPGITQIRGKLALANPRRVEVKLDHGFLSIDVELQGFVSPLVSRYSVPRFSSMLSLGRTPMEMLAAERVVLSEKDGSVTFR